MKNQQGARDAHPNDLVRLLATTCDRGCSLLVTVERVLTMAHVGAIRIS